MVYAYCALHCGKNARVNGAAPTNVVNVAKMSTPDLLEWHYNNVIKPAYSQLCHIDMFIPTGTMQGRLVIIIRRIHVFLVIEGDTRSNDPSFVIITSIVQFRLSPI